MSIRVAVDIGGTFTDAVIVHPMARFTARNPLRFPATRTRASPMPVELLDVRLDRVHDFIHGTTTALNALLERRGARLAMVVTTGFRDVYEIGRANRPEMYNIHYQRPPMLLRRKDIFEIDERVRADGEVLAEVNERELTSLAESIRGNYDAVAVCLINSYRWPDHELASRRSSSASFLVSASSRRATSPRSGANTNGSAQRLSPRTSPRRSRTTSAPSRIDSAPAAFALRCTSCSRTAV